MKTSIKGILSCLLILSSATSHAEMELLAPDGRPVLLKDDMTWRYLEKTITPDDKKRYANLSVVLVDEKPTLCRIGFRLRNDLAEEISNIVLRFSAYTKSNVLYDTVSKGFQNLKPTNEQYQEITIIGLSCSNINSIRVHGGDRCNIGELTKFSDEEGKCLDKVYVETSDKISIYKRYGDAEVPAK